MRGGCVPDARCHRGWVSVPQWVSPLQPPVLPGQQERICPQSHHPQLQLFEEFVDATRWETALGGKGAERSWSLSKDVAPGTQELSIPVC